MVWSSRSLSLGGAEPYRSFQHFNAGIMKTQHKQYLFGLWLCTLLFAFRVIAQPLSTTGYFSCLPPFNTWYSGALPYPVLLISQGLILLLMLHVNVRWSRGIATPHPRTGKLLFGWGALYMTAMLARLMLGLTLLAGHPWFDRPLPTLFHLVLAGYVLILSALHVRSSRSRS